LLPITFGDLLKATRKRQQLSQRQLARLVGVHFNTLWAWERGDYLPATRGLVLELANQLHLSDAETRQFLEASLTALAPYWTVPFPRNPYFTGREALLEDLHSCLADEGSPAFTSSFALSGLGGIGKTQIALEYAYRYTLDYHAVFWLAAETPETLLASLWEIAAALQLPARQEVEQMRLVAEVRRWLSTHRGWLLIGDNVEDVALLQSVLPPSRQGAILLTTRLQALSTLAERLEVPPMSSEEGSLLVARRAKRLDLSGSAQRRQKALLPPDEAAAAASLVTVLEGLPLALDQAGAYIEETGCSVTEYLQRYRQSRQTLLARRGIAGADHPDSVTTTVRLAIKQLERVDPAAAEVLRVCALLQPEAIPEELLVAGAAHLGPVLGEAAADPVRLDQALSSLRRFSLVSRHADTHTLSIHRLVQAVILDDLDPATSRRWSEQVLQAVNATMPPVDFATWPQCERVLPHALLCVALLERGGKDLAESTELLHKAGSYLFERGRYLEAEPLLAQAVAQAEVRHGTEHPLLVPLLVRLGALWHRQGNYDPAQAILLRALALAEQYLEPAHPQKAEALGELGTLYWQQGKDAQAEQVGQRALAICEQHWGPDHPQTAFALANLAGVWQELGRYAEAEPFFLRALAICERSLGLEHPQTADTLNNLTLLHLAQGNTEQAILVGKRALAIFEEQMGPEHPKTAMALNNLALAYRRQGKHAEALPLYQRALAIAEQQLGPEHPHTALTLNNLATVYREQGQYAQAEEFYQRALEIESRQLGPEHQELAYALNNLALLYRATENYAQAEVMGERALQLREQLLGADHPLTATSLATLADVYRAQGKLEHARPLYRRALVICEQRLGLEHPQTCQVRREMASVCCQS
jgi:tetratricopeptide (TPR) repeat protein